MTIDTSGRWWVGTEAADIEPYLKALEPEGYAVDRVNISKCECGGEVFILEGDQEEGLARRTCPACGRQASFGDSAEFTADASFEKLKCTECRGEGHNAGVGLSLYEPSSHDVRWLSIGHRCTKCGVLGSFVNWKVGGGNDPGLLDKA